MKKSLFRFSFFIGGLIALFLVGRITGVFQSYKIPGGTMEPTIKMNSRLFASNLKKPERYSIIVYKRWTNEMDGLGEPSRKLNFTHRLIAFGGEELQIKNGLAYVNGKLVDDSTKLQFEYLVNYEDLNKVAETLKIDLEDPENFWMTYSADKKHVRLPLSFKQLEKIRNITKANRIMSEDGYNEMLYDNDEVKNWTASNYGPVKIPTKCYFVMGDNRNQSADSRYHGFIPEDDWVGTALWKK
jgi:signal peptidase I